MKSLVFRLVLYKLIVRFIVDVLSDMFCLIGISELILHLCYSRSLNLIIADILFGTFISSGLFYYQHLDHMWFDIQRIILEATPTNKNVLKWKEFKKRRFIMNSSFRSPTFIGQIFIVYFSCLITLLSYQHTSSYFIFICILLIIIFILDTWYFILGIVLRHLLLIPQCIPDLCNLIDKLHLNFSWTINVFSRFLSFLNTLVFICVWLGLTIYIIDSSFITQSSILKPSRYVYFVYQILLNVGYGDTTEKSPVSFFIIIIITLCACPIFIIVFQNFIQQPKILATEISPCGNNCKMISWNDLLSLLRKFHRLKIMNEKLANEP